MGYPAGDSGSDRQVHERPTTCLDAGPIIPAALDAQTLIAVARALGHPARLEILELLRTECPRTVGQIVRDLPLAQSTVSKHLKLLRDAGVLRTIRSGPQTLHCLNRSLLAGFAAGITAVTARPTTSDALTASDSTPA